MRLLLILGLVLAIYVQSGLLFVAVAMLLVLSLAVRLWVRRVAGALHVRRTFEPRLFFGETATVIIEIHNRSGLPMPWLLLREHRPADIALPSVISQVISLRALQVHTMTYTLTGRQRGMHAVGPLQLTIGDVLGLALRNVVLPARQYLIVYPRILSPHELALPTQALFGDLRSRRRMLGDPARVTGVRDYTPGDPLQNIHWRATATTGTLQVKQYQPATSIQTMIFLDLQRAVYDREVLQAGELAISIAATVANRLVEQRQEVGLVTNGRLILPSEDRQNAADIGMLLQEMTTSQPITPKDDVEIATPPLPPAKGHGQLMRLLELLARVQARDTDVELLGLLTRHSVTLPWGSTAVIITGVANDALFIALHRLREAGLLVMLFLVARPPDRVQLEARARALGLRLRIVWQDQDLGTTRS